MESNNLLIQISEEQLRTIVRDEFITSIRGHLNRANDKFLTRNEAARHLKITLPTLDKAIKNGELPSYKISGRILLKLSEVNAAVGKIIK